MLVIIHKLLQETIAENIYRVTSRRKENRKNPEIQRLVGLEEAAVSHHQLVKDKTKKGFQ